MARKPSRSRRPVTLRFESMEDRTVPANTPLVRTGWSFAGPQFTDNGAAVLVPASPGIAAGKAHTVTVANAQVQWRAMPAGTASQQPLASLLLPTSGSVLSSPRVAYDPYADRFVVAAISNHTGNGTSSLVLAVSDNGDPNGTWFRKSVQLDNSVTGFTTFGQYLGLAVDEEAVYLTTSQYSAATGGTYLDARVSILDKTAGAGGGLYGGGTATVVGTFDPDTNAANDARYVGLVPATMYNNPTAPGAGVGTFLVAYNGSSAGGANEAVQVVRIDDPLGTPDFTPAQVDVGDIDDTSLPLPVAPQPGTQGIGIDVGARYLGNAVWRDNRLYFAGTVRTVGGASAVHWFQLGTPGNTIQQQANVDTSAVAAGLHAYHPSVAVDALGDLAVSFSASNASNQVLGYYAARTINLAVDPVNTLRAPVVQPAQDTGNEYIRRVGGVNAWGPYSGLTVAANDRVFWTFNAFAADIDLSATAPDQGRWGTAAGAFSFNWPPDVVAPIASFSTEEDNDLVQEIPLDSHFNDLETGAGANLTYAIVGNTNPSLVTASITADGHSIQFDLAPDQHGLAFITVQATDTGTADAAPASTTTSFIMTVTPVNDAPVANPDSYSVDEDTTLNVLPFGVLNNDTDVDIGDGLTAVLVTPPSNAASFTLRPDGSFTYVPNGNFFGTDTFTYRARDGSGVLSALPAATVTITVNPINDAPLTQDDFYSTAEDTPLVVSAPGVLANDTDGDSPSFTAQLVSGPTHASSFTLNPNGSFNYVPQPDYFGPDSFTYNASDGSATSTPLTVVSITVTPVDDAPRPQPDAYQAFEGQLLTVSAADGVLKNDLEVDGPPPAAGQPLTITQATTTTNGTLNFNMSDGSFTYLPNANFSGTDSFTYHVTDGTTPEVGPVTVTFTVNPFDNPPVAAGDSYTAHEDTTLVVPAPGVLANDTDIDSGTFTAELVAGPAHAAPAGFVLNPDGSFSYTPAANYFGPDSFTYRATDATGPGNTVTVNIQVRPVQDGVTAIDDPVGTITKAVRINVLSNDLNPDPDRLTVVSYTKPLLGKITRSGTGLIYTPLPGASGAESFDYTVSDGHGNTDVGTVTLTVADTVKPKVQAMRLGYGSRYADLLGVTRVILPFSGINTVSIVFNENVVVQPTALVVQFNNTTIGTTTTPMVYDAATRTATWTLDAALSATDVGRLTLKLSATGVADGSANNLARDVGKTIGVLPGDYNGNGVVDALDVTAMTKKLGQADRFGDLDGSGIVDQTDVGIATANKGKRLPRA